MWAQTLLLGTRLQPPNEPDPERYVDLDMLALLEEDQPWKRAHRV
jgi:hypothetical protein